MPKQSTSQSPVTETAYSKTVQYYRRLTECTQDEFAVACDIGITTLQDIETGRVKKPRLDTVKKIVIGLQTLGFEVDLDGFDKRVAQYLQPDIQSEKIAIDYIDTPYKKDAHGSRQDMTCLITLLPSAKQVIAEIAKRNDEMRFVRGMGNVLARIEKMAKAGSEPDLEGFSFLMNQFDSFVQEAEKRDLSQLGNIFSLQALRNKLSGFEDKLGTYYKEARDGLIPNGWPVEDVRHHALIEELFMEIQSRKLYLEGLGDLENRDRAVNALEELEIELDRNPLHLKNINVIRARLEELDRDVFQELMVLSQLLLGAYAEQLPPGSVFRDAREAPEMVVIPACPEGFLMGTPEEENRSEDFKEFPQRKVTIDYRFAVGRYPVIFDEWDSYREDHPEAHNPVDNGWGRERRPVMRVSWDDTEGFLQWLKRQTQKPYRLLSETEWEYACRAGTETQYHFGDDEAQLKDYAWYDQNSEDKTHPVGLKKPNQFGLSDMHGNVLEWCEDVWHNGYDGAPSDGSAWMDGHEDTSYRVLRGGSWFDSPQLLRARDRSGFDRVIRYGHVGFRVARALASSQALSVQV
ncbi:MAG: SUMF1/EgtB/PvdO family nonheme iron enzyme [Methyloligellaceae bacterium]